MTEPHRISRRNDLWWCDTEDVVTEDCTDYDRCRSQCVCNNEKEEDEDD